MEPVAVIMEVPEVTRLMDHLGLDAGLLRPARGRSGGEHQAFVVVIDKADRGAHPELASPC